MKTEWKVLVSLFALLLLMEAGARVFETRLSKDLAHLCELPAAAQRLKGGDAYKVLIVGNSLARYGIDQKLLASELEGKGYGQVQVEAFYPDGTGITEWNYGLRRYFLNVGAVPDRIILVTGNKHLLDSVPNPERLGAFYVDEPELKEVIFATLASVEGMARFFLARMSSLFANRSRIEPYVFYNYLPEYTQTIQSINDQRKLLVGSSASNAKKVSNLDRLLKTAHAEGITVSVVAIPMKVPYEMPEEVLKAIRAHQVDLWDLSKLEGINQENFFDGYHLDKEGAKKVTEKISKFLLSE